MLSPYNGERPADLRLVPAVAVHHVQREDDGQYFVRDVLDEIDRRDLRDLGMRTQQFEGAERIGALHARRVRR